MLATRIKRYSKHFNYFVGNVCKIYSESAAMDMSLQKEKSLVNSSHTKQKKNLKNEEVTATSISSQSLPYLKPNTTLLQSDNHKWNPNLTMRTHNLTSNISVNYSDKLKSEKYRNVWKKRKRNGKMHQQSVENLISKAYSHVISSNLPITSLVYVTALLLSIAGTQGQSAFPANNPVPSSTGNRVDSRDLEGPEGFFFATNGSSLATIADSLLSDTSSGHFGLSFRTCTPGELLKQVGDNLDVLKVELTNEGKLQFSLNAQNGDFAITKSLGSNLLDANWHTVLFQFSPQNDVITINISGTQDMNNFGGANGDSVIISSDDVSEALKVLDLSRATSPQLHIGAGFIGCIREGPKVRFTKPGVTVNSAHVKWGRGGNCLLPSKCNGKIQIYYILYIDLGVIRLLKLDIYYIV